MIKIIHGDDFPSIAMRGRWKGLYITLERYNQIMNECCQSVLNQVLFNEFENFSFIYDSSKHEIVDDFQEVGVNEKISAKDLFKSIQDLYKELEKRQESGELNNNVELYYFCDEFDDVRDVIHEKGNCDD